MDRVAVPLVEVALSRLLAVIALVSHYLANKLIARRPFPERLATFMLPQYRELAPLSRSCTRLWGKFPRVTTPSATVQQKFLT